MGLHLLQPTARKRMTGDNGGPSETTLEPSSSVSPAPQHSTGGGRGHFRHGLQDLAFRSSPQEEAHFSCLISMDIISSPTSFAAVSRNSKTQPKTWLFLHFPPRRWYLHGARLPCHIRSLHRTASAPRQQDEVQGTPCHQVFFCLTGIKTPQLFSKEHPKKNQNRASPEGCSSPSLHTSHPSTKTIFQSSSFRFF